MKVCSILNCNNKVVGKGLCEKHYRRFKKYGDPNKTIRNTSPPEFCIVWGCDRPYEAKGFCHNHYMNNYQQTRRKIVIWHYSYGTMRCSCCDESIFRFLTIDHPNNDGAKHRQQIDNGRRAGDSIIVWLMANNLPMGFEVLCYNCNCGRQSNGGICPHNQF